MDFDRIKENLLSNFPSVLPGKTAHLRMAPRPVDARRFNDVPMEGFRKSAVLIVIHPSDEGASFPLIKRPTYQGHHSGQMAFPGGKMDPDDPNVIFTALREAQEEVGLDPSSVQIVGQLSELYIPNSRFLVHPVIGLLDKTPKWVPDFREVDRVLGTSFKTLVQPGIIKETKIPLASQSSLIAPYFDLHREVVWGATAMILSELIEVITDTY